MKLKINGESQTIKIPEYPKNVSNLLKQLNYHPQLIVLEFNGTILPPEDWDKQLIKNGDCFEIVTIVGGGS